MSKSKDSRGYRSDNDIACHINLKLKASQDEVARLRNELKASQETVARLRNELKASQNTARSGQSGLKASQDEVARLQSELEMGQEAAANRQSELEASQGSAWEVSLQRAKRQSADSPSLPTSVMVHSWRPQTSDHQARRLCLPLPQTMHWVLEARSRPHQPSPLALRERLAVRPLIPVMASRQTRQHCLHHAICSR
jgi:hypothetical protein